jgi:hypothetical protein
LLHQDLEFGGFMALTGGKHNCHRLSFAFDAQMQFGTKPALTLA